MSLTSKPYTFLDGRLFVKYDETENKSDQITITDPTQSPSSFTNPLFDYRKVKIGGELGFRLPAKFYLGTTYSYGTINRKREDIPENRDYTYGAELKWKGLDFMAARVGYERLDRKGGIQHARSGGTSDIEYFIRRFDAARKNQDTYKATLDFFPMENLEFQPGLQIQRNELSRHDPGFDWRKA